jgi:TetR/AcrR family transcriptional regulator, acrAB operon repressor
MARRTKADALATRNRILDAAERVFSRRGATRPSLEDIATAAGVTRGAIYWHFRNKADLFGAMLARVTLPMEEMVGGSGDHAAADPLGYIRRCMVTVLRKTTDDAQTRRVFEIVCHKCEYVDEMARVRDRYVEMRADCLGEIERGVRDAIRRGLLPPGVNARSAAVGLHALVDGLISNWLLDPKYFPLAREAERMVDQYLASLATAPARTVRPGGGTRARRGAPASRA